MAGKRLLDVASLINAARGVVQKTATLHARELDIYSRTSTLAKAVKDQTDRVTETAKAASFLASRLNETAPGWAPNNGVAESYSSKESTKGMPASGPKEELEQDHFGARSDSHTTKEPPPVGGLDVKQEKANQYPLPDGTIPPGHSNLNRPERDYDVVSHIPVEAAKKPLLGDHKEDHSFQPVAKGTSTIPIPHTIEGAQGTDEQHGSNTDTYSLPTGGRETAADSLPVTQAVPEQEHGLEGINTDVFSSPRVAKMLGRKSGQSQKDVKLRSAKQGPLDQTKLGEGKDSDTFNVVSSGQQKPIAPESSDANFASPPSHITDQEVKNLARELETNNSDTIPSIGSPYQMKESSVPSSRFGRIWNYGGLAAGMFGGAITESIRRATGSGGDGSFMLSAANMDRLVAKLSRMRGAALKLGQMMSFQDSKLLPAPIQQVLLRVQDSADYMPSYQRDKVLVANLGPEWRELFSEFEEKPIAAASIGQVHKAILKSTGTPVAVKVQYPGVAESIDSDLNNLTILLTASRLLPKGLFLDRTIANARMELGWECDYIREAESGERFQKLLANDAEVFVVPKIYPEASGKQVITMEFMEGVGVTKVQDLTQEQKDWIGTQILRLCLKEITEFRFMQTDPNWTNFLFNKETNKLELLDFGASREYPREFIDKYTTLLLAASRSDRKKVAELSVELGYFTGHESKAMLDAHIASVLTLAEPFLGNSPKVYDFRDQTITERVKALIPVMVKERLAPPPEETYSLHRKLSGAFLLCARLGSRVRCRELFENSMSKAGLL